VKELSMNSLVNLQKRYVVLILYRIYRICQHKDQRLTYKSLGGEDSLHIYHNKKGRANGNKHVKLSFISKY
jgi:hypothetical protein